MSIRDSHAQRVLSQGSSKGQRDKNKFINSMINAFNESPSYFEVSINDSSTLTGVQIYDNTSKEKVDTAKNMIMKPHDVIDVGDSIHWNDMDWLCIQTEMFSDVYIKAVIMQYNNQLKYMDVNLSLHSIPCIVTKSTIKTDDGTYMEIQSTQIFVIIADNEQSKMIHEDMRFILGNRVYQINSLENITQKGLINLKLVQTASVPTDNFTTGIADNDVLRQIPQSQTVVEEEQLQSTPTPVQTTAKKKLI